LLGSFIQVKNSLKTFQSISQLDKTGAFFPAKHTKTGLFCQAKHTGKPSPVHGRTLPGLFFQGENTLQNPYHFPSVYHGPNGGPSFPPRFQDHEANLPVPIQAEPDDFSLVLLLKDSRERVLYTWCVMHIVKKVRLS